MNKVLRRAFLAVLIALPVLVALTVGVAAVNRFAGQTFSLPQQVYLHAPASCAVNAPCNIPGVTFQASRPTAAGRQAH